MLTTSQARFFARNGYLQLPQIVPRTTCASLIEATWNLLPPHWRREQPSSWQGMVTDSCHTGQLAGRSGLLKFQRKELAVDPGVEAAFQPGSPVHEAARALLGKPLERIRTRGLYTIAPTRPSAGESNASSPHIEAHPVQIIALCYLDEVAPGGGGLLVWPGSHRDFHGAFDSKLEHVANDRLPGLLQQYRKRPPTELPGAAGDVILIHHRLLHSPSINRGERLRFGFLCDYVTTDYRELCRQPPGDSLWEDWPGLVALASAEHLDAPSDVGPTVFTSPTSRPSLIERVLAAFQARPQPETQSSRNKADASRLARQRRPGDVWLSISDSPAWFDRRDSLDPQGNDLRQQGVRVTCNGVELSSESHGDLTTRLRLQPGSNTVSVTGHRGPLWVRVIELRLPFTASTFLYRQAVTGSPPSAQLEFRIEPTPAVASRSLASDG